VAVQMTLILYVNSVLRNNSFCHANSNFLATWLEQKSSTGNLNQTVFYAPDIWIRNPAEITVCLYYVAFFSI